MDADGDFIVTWCSTFRYGDAPPYVFTDQDVISKRYSADGTELPPATGVPPGGSGNEFRSGDHLGGEGLPDVTRDAAGDAVVVWQDYGHAGTGSTFDVWGQRYDDSTDTAGPIVSGLSAPGTPVFTGKPVVHPVTELVVDFSEALNTGDAGTSGPASLSNYRLTRDGSGDVSSLITGVTFAFNPDTRKFEATLALSAPLPGGSYVLTVSQAITDLAANALDGNLDGTPGGGDASVAFVVHIIPPPVLQSIAVNDGSAQRSMVKSLALHFDQPVSLAAGAARLDLLNTGGSGANDGSGPTAASTALGAPSTPDGGKTWVFTFAAASAFVQKSGGGASTGSLIDGIYQLNIDPTKVTVSGVAMAAAPAPFTFHRLFGDIDGNNSVSTLDFGLFRNAFGNATGQAGFNPAFDFDGNGSANTLDYGQFRNRYGKPFSY